MFSRFSGGMPENRNPIDKNIFNAGKCHNYLGQPEPSFAQSLLAFCADVHGMNFCCIEYALLLHEAGVLVVLLLAVLVPAVAAVVALFPFCLFQA